MKKYSTVTIIFAFWGLILINLLSLTKSSLAAVENNGSLWNDSGNLYQNLYQDNRARQLGDVITVLISETSAASTTSKTQITKDGEAKISAGNGLLDFLPASGGQTSSSFQGDGKTQSEGRLTAKITAQIVEILPNGNLKVEGSRTIKVYEDNQEIKISGIVRPHDISSQNTVLSSQLANAEISYDGSGTVSRGVKTGLISRVFNLIF